MINIRESKKRTRPSNLDEQPAPTDQRFMFSANKTATRPIKKAKNSNL